MVLIQYIGRLRRDFRKTFESPEGRHVLMHLYTHRGGNKIGYRPGCSAIDLAFADGKRFAWLMILDNLREEDDEMRKYLIEHLAERRREEEMNER